MPSFSKIACFNTDYNLLPDILGDFRDQVKANQFEEVVNTCAELAFGKAYKFFALGYNGRCRSGPNAQKEYYIKSIANDANCPNGIGIDKRIVVYTFGKLIVNLYIDRNKTATGTSREKHIGIFLTGVLSFNLVLVSN